MRLIVELLTSAHGRVREPGGFRVQGPVIRGEIRRMADLCSRGLLAET